MDFVGIMYNMHVQVTAYKPLCHNKVTIQQRPPLMPTDVTILGNNAFVEFQKLNLAYGSVHKNYKVWVQFFIDAVNSQQSSEILIPNGCCTTDQCPVKLFYEILAKHYNNYSQ
jgi:hypothetical protein